MTVIGKSGKNKLINDSNFSYSSFEESGYEDEYFGWLASKLYDELLYYYKINSIKALGIKKKVSYTTTIKSPVGDINTKKFTELAKWCKLIDISVGSYIDSTLSQQQMAFINYSNVKNTVAYSRYVSKFPEILFNEDNKVKYFNAVNGKNRSITSINTALLVDRKNRFIRLSGVKRKQPLINITDYVLNLITHFNSDYEKDFESLLNVISEKSDDIKLGVGELFEISNSRLRYNIEDYLNNLTNSGLSYQGAVIAYAIRVYGMSGGSFNYYPVLFMNNISNQVFRSLYDDIYNKSWSKLKEESINAAYWFTFGWDSKIEINKKLDRLKDKYGSIYNLKDTIMVFVSISEKFKIIELDKKYRLDIERIL